MKGEGQELTTPTHLARYHADLVQQLEFGSWNQLTFVPEEGRRGKEGEGGVWYRGTVYLQLSQQFLD